MSLFTTYEKRVAHISIVVVFLALIRCLFEFYRLEFLLKEDLTIAILKPFILGALVSSVSAFAMVVFYFFSKYKYILAVGILALVLLFGIKIIYSVN